MFSGICQSPFHSGCAARAEVIKSAQMGSAESAPVKPNCELSSKPTQTTQTMFGVKPANQPSREVPVFPATPTLPGTFFKPHELNFAAVPRLTTSFIKDVIT